ncbi:MAG: hypothetical protein PHY12_06900 [Eubacteriales bacterium]|nr:hypothetical protein [Eubacteriales bacterium]
MTLEELMIQISVATDGSDEALADLKGKIKQFADESRQSTEQGAAAQTAAWTAVSAAATTAFAKIVAAIGTGIEASNKYAASMRGLESIATASGIGTEVMQTALDGVVDKFFDAAAAATAYKNLLSRGYTLDQATTTITRLKNAAAYGRQASLSLKDAVVTATEGIRNENSILVDNAGVTKNVSVMWKEYAKSIGVSVDSLTQAQKIEAEYQGILQETTAQVGDLKKMSEGLAGAQAEAGMQGERAYRALGEAMTPLVEAGAQLETTLFKSIAETAEACPALAAGLTSSATAMTALVAGASALKALGNLFGGMSAIKSILTPMGLAAAAVGLLATAWTAYSKAQEADAQAEKERVQAVYEAADASKSSLSGLDKIIDRYEALSKKNNLTYDEQVELNGLQEQVKEAYGISAEGVNGLTKSTQDYIDTLRVARIEQLKDLQTKQAVAAGEARLKAASDDNKAAVQAYRDALAALDNAKAHYATGMGVDVSSVGDDNPFVANEKKAAEDAKAALAPVFADYKDWVNKALDDMSSQMQIAGRGWESPLADQLAEMFAIDFTQFEGTPEEIQSQANEYVNGIVSAITTACSDADVSAAIESLQGIKDKSLAGVQLTEDDITAMQDAWAVLADENGPLAKAAEALTTDDESAQSFLATLLAMIAPIQQVGGSAEATAAALNNQADSLHDVAYNAEQTQKDISTLETKVQSLQSKWNNVSAVQKNIQAWRDLRKEYDQAKAKGTDLTNVQERMKTAAQSVGQAYDGTADSMAACDKGVDTLAKTMKADSQSMYSDLENVLAEALQVQAGLNIQASMGVDVSQSLSAVSAVIAVIRTLLALMGQAGVTAKKTGGGGGRKSSPTPTVSAGPSTSPYDDAIASMEHLKQVSEMTYEQELEYLRRIQREVQMTGEEQLDYAERVYAVQKQIAERDAQSLNSLTEALKTALAERYSAMKDAELDTLDASRENWEEWRESNVSAVQAQIDALDELAQAEDREASKEDALRKIAKLKESLQYEQDAYNRAKIQQQLDAAQKTYDDLLKKYDRQDQKDALRDQLDKINAEADAQLAALDKQQAEIEAAYAERLKAASLEAEAEKLLMESTQEQIIQLISDFAPDYNATGKTLGEQLLAGFQNQVGSVVTWINNLNQQIASAQQKMAQLAQQAATDFYADAANRQQAQAGGVTVNQTNNFNTPVETPGETARRVAQANEALAEEVLSGR